ncbi:leucine-rich repeat protein SHOC-2-like isoform X2 [Panicum miliaceum]|uniref:Leucine-rich repeat protein SHOC-2-like isoform X2 n=1 Tax=Panicum miliaceum TaxID=4540 RepID=A0A3L6T8Q7_PANMI|nr:leucine-rich repeat protein SHOC-2-like isoform X2 [Panicum miliaceum]
MPNGVIQKLTSLEQLQIKPVDADKSRDPFVKELGNLSELRVLRINNNEPNVKESMQSDLLQSVGNLHKLQILILDGWFIRPEQQPDKDAWDTAALPRHLRHLILPSVWFYSLPSCIKASSLPCLSHLFLNVYGMDEEGLRVLGGLPELRYLYLTTVSTIVLHEDPSSGSLCIWNGSDDVTSSSGSRKDGFRVAAPAVIMPNLEVLDFKVQADIITPTNAPTQSLNPSVYPTVK